MKQQILAVAADHSLESFRNPKAYEDMMLGSMLRRAKWDFDDECAFICMVESQSPRTVLPINPS